MSERHVAEQPVASSETTDTYQRRASRMSRLGVAAFALGGALFLGGELTDTVAAEYAGLPIMAVGCAAFGFSAVYTSLKAGESQPPL